MTQKDPEQLNEVRATARAPRIENEVLRRKNRELERQYAVVPRLTLPSPFDVFVWDGRVVEKGSTV